MGVTGCGEELAGGGGGGGVEGASESFGVARANGTFSRASFRGGEGMVAGVVVDRDGVENEDSDMS